MYSFLEGTYNPFNSIYRSLAERDSEVDFKIWDDKLGRYCFDMGSYLKERVWPFKNAVPVFVFPGIESFVSDFISLRKRGLVGENFQDVLPVRDGELADFGDDFEIKSFFRRDWYLPFDAKLNKEGNVESMSSKMISHLLFVTPKRRVLPHVRTLEFDDFLRCELGLDPKRISQFREGYGYIVPVLVENLQASPSLQREVLSEMDMNLINAILERKKVRISFTHLSGVGGVAFKIYGEGINHIPIPLRAIEQPQIHRYDRLKDRREVREKKFFVSSLDGSPVESAKLTLQRDGRTGMPNLQFKINEKSLHPSPLSAYEGIHVGDIQKVLEKAVEEGKTEVELAGQLFSIERNGKVEHS